MSLRRVVKCRFLAHAAVRALGGAGGADRICLDQGFEESSSRSSWLSNMCCGDSFSRHRLSSAIPIAESYPDPEQEAGKFREETLSSTNAVSHVDSDETPASSSEVLDSAANQASMEQGPTENAAEASTQGKGEDAEGTCGGSVLESGFESKLVSEQQDESTCGSASGDSSAGGPGDAGVENVSGASEPQAQTEISSTEASTAQEAATQSQPHSSQKAPSGAPPSMRIPSSRAEMLRNPFMYESYILQKLSTSERVRTVEDAMDEGEFVNSSFFGYVFLQPSSLDNLLAGIETMKRHLMSRKETEKDVDYTMASRFFIPWLVKFNQTGLLFKILEHPKEYGLVRVQGALTGAVKIWRLAGRVDLLERAMNILIDQGDKLHPEFIRSTLEAYLNAGLFQEAQAFRTKIMSKGWRVPLAMEMWMEEVARGRKWAVIKDFSWQLKPNGTVNLRVWPVRKWPLKEGAHKQKGKRRGRSGRTRTQTEAPEKLKQTSPTKLDASNE